MKSSQNIIFYMDKPLLSGLALRIGTLVDSLRESGCEVNFVSLEPLEHPGVENHIVSLPSWPILARVFAIPLVWFELLVLGLSGFRRTFVVFSPAHSLLLKPISLLCFSPLVLFVDALPWFLPGRKKRFFLTRFFLNCADWLGLCCASRIAVSSSCAADIVKRRLVFPSNKIRSVPFSAYPAVNEQTDCPQESTNGEVRGRTRVSSRKTGFSKKFGLPERAFFVSFIDDHAPLHKAEFVVRAIAALENDRVFLVLYGNNDKLQAVVSIAVSLGLSERMVVIECEQSSPEEVVCSCELHISLQELDEGAERLINSLGYGAVVFASDNPLSREILGDERLIFDPTRVDSLVEKLRIVSSDKDELQRYEKLCRERLKAHKPCWAEQAREFLCRK